MVSTIFTLFHVAISLAGLVSGLVSLSGLLRATIIRGWTAIFLATTVATSVTGFLFRRDHFTPGHAIGIISLVTLGLAIFALDFRHLRGAWRRIYVVSAIASLYLNAFVAIVQAFMKIPVLKAAAPNQTEPAFIVAQIVLMMLFLWFGWRCWASSGRSFPASQVAASFQR